MSFIFFFWLTPHRISLSPFLSLPTTPTMLSASPMLSSRSLLLSILSLLSIAFFAPSAYAATSANASVTGPQTLANSSLVPTGFYAFRNVVTGQYLQFIDEGNVITPATVGSVNNTIWSQTVWSVKFHGDKNYSIHHFNRVQHEKCVSTRWDYIQGIDDAAVMWQCELDNETPATIDFNFSTTPSPPAPQKTSKRVSRRQDAYDPIRSDKQQWVFVPVNPSNVSWGNASWGTVTFDPNSGTNVIVGGPPVPAILGMAMNLGSSLFYIVSTAHLWNMVPRCLYPQVNYAFDFTANNTGVTILQDCQAGNESLVWEMILIKAENFPLGGGSAGDGTGRSGTSSAASARGVAGFSVLAMGVLVALAGHWVVGW